MVSEGEPLDTQLLRPHDWRLIVARSSQWQSAGRRHTAQSSSPGQARIGFERRVQYGKQEEALQSYKLPCDPLSHGHMATGKKADGVVTGHRHHRVHCTRCGPA